MTSALNDLVKAMENSDYDAVSACFSKDAIFDDYGPSIRNQDSYHLYGKNGINMFFHHKFFFDYIKVKGAIINCERTASYHATYGKDTVLVEATIRSFDEEGKIKSLVVRPL